VSILLHGNIIPLNFLVHGINLYLSIGDKKDWLSFVTMTMHSGRASLKLCLFNLYGQFLESNAVIAINDLTKTMSWLHRICYTS